VRQVLTACGLSEAMTFAFIEASAAAPFADPATVVGVANPLSEKYAVLRPSLLPGLIDAAAHNRRREHHDVRLFETGTRFSTAGETRAAAGVWCGAGAPPHWSGGARDADFFDVKGAVEAIAAGLGLELEFEPAVSHYFVEGRTAAVNFRLKAEATETEKGTDSVVSAFRRKTDISRRFGLLGQIAPAVLAARGFPAGDALYAFELDLDAVPALTHVDDLRAESLPRFPSVVRDVSVLVDSALPAAAVRGTIRSSAPAALVNVVEFDRYRGKGVPEGRVSLSLRLTFRSPERTLTDAEVDAAMERIVRALADAHGAVQR
jgi:phenylalanyl-tRNA synthetase beta chain